MLIVDSPFPPYSPIEVDVFAEPKIGNLDTASKGFVDGSMRWKWANDKGLLHREGDYPALWRENQWCQFYKCGVKHRLNGYAITFAGRESGVHGAFYLYGGFFNKDDFQAVNATAIKYSIPLYIAVLAHYFKVKIDDFVESTVWKSGMLKTIPVEWLLKLWNVDERNFVQISYNDLTFEYFVKSMQQVVDYEQMMAKRSVPNASR